MSRQLIAAVVVWLFAYMSSVAQAESRPALPVPQQIARLAANPALHAAFDWFRRQERQISDWQLELARVPAPPFDERHRAEWLAERFRGLGLEDVAVDDLGNVFGVRRGTDPNAQVVALTAHIDTVFPAGTPLDVRRDQDRLYGPGISDNGAGVSALFALASAMLAAKLRTAAPIVFIGNVGEEGEGNLRGMRHIFDNPKWRDAIGATIVLDGAGSDTVVTQALGSRRFEVTVRGPGGHSWSDFGVPNPIVVLARAIDVFSRTNVPADPKTTFNVGLVRGGTSVNAIPENVSMKVDIRSAEPTEIDRVEAALREAVRAAVEQANAARRSTNGREPPAELTAEIRLIGSRPAAELKPGARIIEIVRAVDAQLGIATRTHRSSTDANIPLSLGREAVAMGAGGAGGGAHTQHEWYDPRDRDLGLKRILLAVAALAGM